MRTRRKRGRKTKGKGNYAQCWDYLKKNDGYFYIVGVIFLIAIVVGLFWPVFFVEQIGEFIRQLAEKTIGMNFWQLLVFIFRNNLMSSFFGLILGILFGIFPIITAVSNGYVLGFVSRKTGDIFGYPILWRLAPHGIFEIPALILSLGLGLKLGTFIFAKKGRRKKQLVYDLANALKIFFYIIIPLLIIAAIIESGLIVFLD